MNKTFCIVSTSEEDGHNGLRVVTQHHPFWGSETTSIDDLDDDQPLLGNFAFASEIMYEIYLLDERYFPPVSPVVGLWEGDKLVGLCEANLSNDGKAWLSELAAKYRLAVIAAPEREPEAISRTPGFSKDEREKEIANIVDMLQGSFR